MGKLKHRFVGQNTVFIGAKYLLLRELFPLDVHNEEKDCQKYDKQIKYNAADTTQLDNVFIGVIALLTSFLEALYQQSGNAQYT